MVQIVPCVTLAVGAVVEGDESNSRRTWVTPKPLIEVLLLVAALATALVDSCILGVALRTTTSRRESLASASLPRYNSACSTPPTNVLVR